MPVLDRISKQYRRNKRHGKSMGTHQEDIALLLSRPMVIIQEQSFGRTVSRAQGRSHLSRQHDRETRLDRCVITTMSIPASTPSIRQGKWLHETVPCLRGKSPECGRRGRVLRRAKGYCLLRAR